MILYKARVGISPSPTVSPEGGHMYFTIEFRTSVQFVTDPFSGRMEEKSVPDNIKSGPFKTKEEAEANLRSRGYWAEKSTDGSDSWTMDRIQGDTDAEIVQEP